MKLDTKLDHFYDSVIEDATNQANSIIKDYEESLNTIYNNQKADELRKARLAFRVETDHLIRQKNKAISTEKNEIRKAVSKKTAELKELLFADVEKKLLDFMKTDEYIQLLIDQIESAISFAREDEMIIYINPSDADKKERLEKACNFNILISSTDFMGGTRAVIHSRNILIDNSFLTRLAEEKEIFTF